MALRFLSPSHQYRSYEDSRKYTAQSFARYLRQPHKAKLLNWEQFRWDGAARRLDMLRQNMQPTD